MRKFILKLMILLISFVALHDVLYIKSDTHLKKEVVTSLDGHSLLHQAAIVEHKVVSIFEAPFILHIKMPSIAHQFTPNPLTPPPRT